MKIQSIHSVQSVTFLLALFMLTSCGAVTPLPASTNTPVPTPAKVCAPAGTHAEELLSGGRARKYWLHVPPGYQPGQPIALVFGFHGNGGRAEQFESYSGFSILADRESFIAVYPQGQGDPAGWNADPGAKNEDVQFVRDLIDHLETRCNIDTARIYAVGHSRGGGMANRLACDLAERIAAIGSVAGAYMGGEDCAPVRPVPVVAVHGDSDPIIPYNGIPNNGMPPAAYFLIGTPVPQWASNWAWRNGCNMKAVVFLREELVTGQRWEACRSAAEVVLYSLKGWGHGWPGAVGAPIGEFNSTQVIWSFLAQHPYP